ncbi:DUF1203 domain-containing protein [soil metagenome]
MSGFVLRGLDPAPFAPLFALDDAALAARDARRVIATNKPGFPCRVSLEDAEPGETLILANFEHLPVDSPFRSRHAVYVRAGTGDPAEYRDALPEQFRTRTLSLRAFDNGGMMIDADLADGREAETTIMRMLADTNVAYLHAHFAKPGCFAARIDRG